MTRAEHLAKAKRSGVVAGVSLLVSVVALLVGRGSGNPLPGLLGVLALLGAGVATVSAGYRLLMGLARPADWKPLEGAPLDRFEPEEEERSLRKRAAQELGARLVGEVTVEHENIVGPYPDDDRSSWQRFLQSSEPMMPRYRLTLSVPADTRPITLSVWIGRSKKDAAYSRIRVVLEADCQSSLDAPITWRDGFGGEDRRAPLLASDQGLANLLSGLVRRRVRSGGRWVVHPDPTFVLAPVGTEGHARATLDTVEQDWKGGFSVKLGLDGFLTAVDRIESALAERPPSQ